jgi:hypothetical protein
MSKYQKGKIYKLVNDEMPDKIYFGSTINDLNIRLSQHKSKSNKSTSKILFEKGNVKIILVEEYPCENRKQLEKKERNYIENNECINKNIPTRTLKEYNEDNKEKIKERIKKYNEKMFCSCGLFILKRKEKEHFELGHHKMELERIEWKRIEDETCYDSTEE